MERISRRLASHQRIAIDTPILIYHLEGHHRYRHASRSILNGVRDGEYDAIVSTVALMEILVRPFALSRPDIARHYEALLAHFPNLRITEVSRGAARRAARLRAELGLRPADALHAGVALTSGATAFVTNDRRLTRLSEVLDVVVLDDVL